MDTPEHEYLISEYYFHFQGAGLEVLIVILWENISFIYKERRKKSQMLQ